MKTRQWQSISERARDLVVCMLTVDAKERITADGVLSHPWLVVSAFLCYILVGFFLVCGSISLTLASAARL